MNKKKRFEINLKPIYTSRDEGFDENFVSTSWKKLLPLAGISAKIQENGFNEQGCSYLKIVLHLISRMVSTIRKKTLNKNKKVCNLLKTISTSQNEGFVEKYDFSGPRDYFHLNQCLKKLKKTVFTSRNKIFVNIGIPVMAVMVSKKI